jgi:lysophospholipase L1-like esterase
VFKISLIFIILCPFILAKEKGFSNEPSSAEQLEKYTKVISKGPFTGNMSKEQAAWEKVLENNLGGFYYPRYIEAKKAGKETAWDFVKDNPDLPRVLIIGDSISRGYTIPVRNKLKGKVNLHRAPANCGPTRTGLKKLSTWLGSSKKKWDIITFNFGIHDRRTKGDTYVKTLKSIIKQLKATGATLIWVNTTPVPKGANEYVKGASEKHNELAEKIMNQYKISIVDLYSTVSKVPAKDKIPKNCHFNSGGYEVLGGVVAKAVLKQLPKTK